MTLGTCSAVTLLNSNDRYAVGRVCVRGSKVLPPDHGFLCVAAIEGACVVDGREVKMGSHFGVPSFTSRGG